MSCEGNVCGTGGWTGPLPGDPDNGLILKATPALGGIDITVTYPTTNPFAVAYIELYRGYNDLFENAVPLTKFTGEHYFDRLDSDLTYFYWIKMVSINGTEGTLIGPASAKARFTAESTLELLTGMIDAGVLAQALKTEIARIGSLDHNINKEIQDRLASNTVLSDALSAVQTNLDTALTYVQQEITQRRDGDATLVDAINAIAVGASGNSAAITQEQQVRAGKDAALASDIAVLYADVGANTAAIDNERSVRVDQTSSLAQQIDALSASFNDGSTSAALQQEIKARADADSALSQSITTFQAKVDKAEADVQSEQTARVNADGALAQQINTAQSTLNGNISQVQQTLQTNINSVANYATGFGALYTVKTNVNGLIGGFGTYNDGNTVQMGFDVDSFWVGRTNDQKVKPFIIDQGIVYMDKVRIRDADIDTLKIAGNAVTTALSAFTSGRININGSLVYLQSIAINSTGAPIFISFSGTVVAPVVNTFDSEGNSYSTPVNCYVELWRNGNAICRLEGVNGTFSFSLQDIPGSGVATYQLVTAPYTSNGVAGYATNRCIALIETKR